MSAAYLAQVDASEELLLLHSAEAVEARLDEARKEGERWLDLDEDWAGLHFTLSGDLPLSRPQALELGISWNEEASENVLMGGEATPRETQFGPVRYLRPELVRRMAAKLSSISPSDFIGGFDADAMIDDEIPPGYWDDTPEIRDRLRRRFEQLVAFYQAAAAAGQGILIKVWL